MRRPIVEPSVAAIDPPSSTPLVEGDSKTIKAILFLLKGGPLIILAVLVVGLWAFTENHVFMSYGNIGNILEQSAGVCVIAIGQLLVILTRGIDLSIGSNVSLGCVVCVVVFRDTKSPTQAIVYTLLTGLAIGVVNGIVLVKGRLPHPFIATLGHAECRRRTRALRRQRLDDRRRALAGRQAGRRPDQGRSAVPARSAGSPGRRSWWWPSPSSAGSSCTSWSGGAGSTR